ncbi:MAG: hypothetical protein KDD69_17045 [Bdellovibrionales bacterium]|nr:hypothetical protein [Bdellovibrionales bacterium]
MTFKTRFTFAAALFVFGITLPSTAAADARSRWWSSSADRSEIRDEWRDVRRAEERLREERRELRHAIRDGNRRYGPPRGYYHHYQQSHYNQPRSNYGRCYSPPRGHGWHRYRGRR